MGTDLTPCFFLKSFDKVADMILCLMWEGAEKWAFLDLRLLLVTSEINDGVTNVSFHVYGADLII